MQERFIRKFVVECMCELYKVFAQTIVNSYADFTLWFCAIFLILTQVTTNTIRDNYKK